MSIFSDIVSKVFGHSSVPGASAATGAKPAAGAPSASAAPTGAPVGATGKPMTQVDVEAMIGKLAAASREKYNWQQSIVDLMKLLNLDSSLTARKHLAQELGYTGALDGSAEMNIWLHKQVMTKLAESGGKVPDSLRA
jgi:hypothetical protein